MTQLHDDSGWLRRIKATQNTRKQKGDKRHPEETITQLNRKKSYENTHPLHPL